MTCSNSSTAHQGTRTTFLLATIHHPELLASWASEDHSSKDGTRSSTLLLPHSAERADRLDLRFLYTRNLHCYRYTITTLLASPFELASERHLLFLLLIRSHRRWPTNLFHRSQTAKSRVAIGNHANDSFRKRKRIRYSEKRQTHQSLLHLFPLHIFSQWSNMHRIHLPSCKRLTQKTFPGERYSSRRLVDERR